MSIEIRIIHCCDTQEVAWELGSRFPKHGHSVPIVCSVDAPALFIECPYDGHRVFNCWSMSFMLEVCRSCVFISSEPSWCFDELSMQLLWYFSDTSMILLVKINKKYHWRNVLSIRWIALNLMQKWDFDTFFAEKTCI